MTKLIFVDTETTGLEVAQGHRIIELGCVEMVNRKLTKRNFHRYLNPDREIDPGAQQIHGISLEFLADKPRFADVIDEFLDYLGDADLVIHNAAFDVGFINAELRLLGKPGIDQYGDEKRNILDTWKLAKEQFPGKKNSLDALCERFAVDNSARTFHGALLDAELLSEVYLALTRGQDSLDIGLAAGPAKGIAAVPVVRPASLKVLRASAEELQAHAEVVERLQKASGGKAVWAAADEPVADAASSK